jgi:hypothetical protein
MMHPPWVVSQTGIIQHTAEVCFYSQDKGFRLLQDVLSFFLRDGNAFCVVGTEAHVERLVEPGRQFPVEYTGP